MTLSNVSVTRRTAAAVGAAALCALSLPLSVPPAQALPPGGASPSTPGTSSSVSPTQVTPCSSLSFEVSGFPAGETVSVKFDDGAGYSDQSVQFTGVVATQRISSSGTASGTVTVPCDMSEGEHWLRFLSSEVNTGTGGGNIGYSNKSPNFTVVAQGGGDAATTGGGTTSDSTDGGNSQNNSNSNNSNTTSGGGGRAAAAAGGGAAATIVEEVVEGGGGTSGSGNSGNSGNSAGGGTTADGKAIGADGSAFGNSGNSSSSGTGDNSGTTAGEAQYVAQSAAVSGNRVPWIGIFVGGAILLVGMTAINVWVFLQRRDK